MVLQNIKGKLAQKIKIKSNQENGIRIGKKQLDIIVYFASFIDFQFNTW